jgi:hypothetical protein
MSGKRSRCEETVRPPAAEGAGLAARRDARVVPHPHGGESVRLRRVPGAESCRVPAMRGACR